MTISAAAPIALASRAAGPILGGIGAMNRARSLREQENINAEIGQIRANQTDTVARRGLEDDLAHYRSVLSANDAAPSVATLQLLNGVRALRDRDRRIGTANANQDTAAARRRANSYRPGIALATGFAEAGPSLVELYGELR